MADPIPSNSRNRRYFWASEPWITYVGDLKALETYLDSKTGIPWLIPKFFDSLLRGIGQVVFANNPITGLVILAVLFWAGGEIGLATLLSATTAILTAVLMKMDPSSIRAGLTTFNAVLVGCVTASLWTPLYNEPLSPKIWGFIVLGSILSVFIASGLGTILSKWGLPGLTLPFNVVTLLLFVCLMPPLASTPGPTPVTSNSSALEDKAIEKADDLVDWLEVLHGIILSMGEVFAVDTFAGSIVMLLGMIIYSPLLTIMSFIGGVLGTLFGLVLVPTAKLGPVYFGLWGYNGILSASSVGGFFFAPNTHSFLTSLVNVMFTAIIQYGLSLSFAPLRLPVLTLPFVLSTLIFLSVTTVQPFLKRVVRISFPEMHRNDYIEELRMITVEQQRELERITKTKPSGTP